MRTFSPKKIRSGKSPSGYVWCSNRNYAFSLTRQNERSPWLLVSVAPKKNEVAYRKIGEDLTKSLGHLQEPVRLTGVSLEKLIHQPDFLVVREEVLDDKKGTIRVEFTNIHHPVRRQYPIMKGWLILDTVNHFVLLKSETFWSFEGGDEIREIDYEYLPGPPGYPIPRQIKARRLSANDRGHVLGTVTDWYDVSPGKMPKDSELTLSAFGFPEPLGLEPSPTRWYLWMALAGIACLGLVALFRWIARRANRTSKNLQP